MILPDVNVLIFAFRKDAALHEPCRRWLGDVVSGAARFGVSPLVLAAVVRITTNRRAYREPSTPQEAFGFCNFLLQQHHCDVVEPGQGHWEIFQRLCVEPNTRGRDVSDAWFAALAIERGCEWVTCDADFARFPGLNWRRIAPLARDMEHPRLRSRMPGRRRSPARTIGRAKSQIP